MPLNNYTIYQEPLIHLKTWESLPSVNYQQDILTHINQQLVDTSLMLLHNCLRQNRLIFLAPAKCRWKKARDKWCGKWAALIECFPGYDDHSESFKVHFILPFTLIYTNPHKALVPAVLPSAITHLSFLKTAVFSGLRSCQGTHWHVNQIS